MANLNYTGKVGRNSSNWIHLRDRSFRGDEEAASALASAIRNQAYATAGKYLTSRADREDAAQETWLKTAHLIHKAANEDNLKAYIKAATFTTCMSIGKKRAELARREVTLGEASTAIGVCLGIGISYSELLTQWLAMLSPRERTIMLLKVNGETTEDIGRLLGLSIGSIGGYVKQARNRLARLERGCDSLRNGSELDLAQSG